jgi:hypothetical protein
MNMVSALLTIEAFVIDIQSLVIATDDGLSCIVLAGDAQI